MKQTFLIYFLFLCAISLFGQEKILEITNDLGGKEHKKIKEVFTVVDKETNNLAVFLDNNKTLNAYLYDENQNLLNKILSEGLPNKYSSIIGHTFGDQQIKLLVRNDDGSKFGSILYDFKKGTAVEHEYDFKLKKELYLASYSTQKEIYVVTLPRRTSDLKFTVFNHNGDVTEKTVPLEKREFVNNPGFTESFERIIYYMIPGHAAVVDGTIPNSLKNTSSRIKMYPQENGFTLTLDKNPRNTFIVSVKIPEMEISEMTVRQPLSKIKYFSDSNSFLHENRLYQIASNSKNFGFRITDLSNQEVLKDLNIKKTDSISIKNSPIFLYSASLKHPEKSETTKKFFKNLSKYRTSVAVLKKDHGYQVTLGSASVPAVRQGGFGVGFGGFGGFATAGFAINVNPIMYSYTTYGSSIATRIECLFDENFNHLKDKETEFNTFDKIKRYTKYIIKDEISAQTVFKYKNDIIFGCYNKETKTYLFSKF